MKKYKKTILLICFGIVLIKWICGFLFKTEDMFYFSESDIRVIYNEDELFIDSTQAWNDVEELGSTYKLKQLGLVDEAISPKYKLEILNLRHKFKGTIYEIDMSYYDPTRNPSGPVEMPINEKEYIPYPTIEFNKIYGSNVILEIQGKYIILDQQFYDNLENALSKNKIAVGYGHSQISINPTASVSPGGITPSLNFSRGISSTTNSAVYHGY